LFWNIAQEERNESWWKNCNCLLTKYLNGILLCFDFPLVFVSVSELPSAVNLLKL
jgi:hypothetical protein